MAATQELIRSKGGFSQPPSGRPRRRDVETGDLASGLDETTKAHIYRQSRRGVSVEVLAVQSGLGRSQVAGVINEMRAKRLLENKLEFMNDPDFEDPEAVVEILGPYPQPATQRSRRPRAPEGLPPYLVSLYDVPLLTREQE